MITNKEQWIGKQRFSCLKEAFLLFGYDAPKSEQRHDGALEPGAYVKTILEQYQGVLMEEQCLAIIWYGLTHSQRLLTRMWVWNRKPVLEEALMGYRLQVLKGKRARATISNNEWIGSVSRKFHRVGLAFQIYGHRAPLPDEDSKGKPTSGAYVLNILDQYRQVLTEEEIQAIIWYGLTNEELHLLNHELGHPSLLGLVEAYHAYVTLQEVKGEG